MKKSKMNNKRTKVSYEVDTSACSLSFSVHLSTHRSFHSLSRSFQCIQKKECPSCDGSGSLTSSGQVDGKTERIKNECSMMRHKKVACKAFSITPHKFLHFDMKKT